MAEETWKDKLVDMRLTQEEATEFERLTIEEHNTPEKALEMIMTKRHHEL